MNALYGRRRRPCADVFLPRRFVEHRVELHHAGLERGELLLARLVHSRSDAPRSRRARSRALPPRPGGSGGEVERLRAQERHTAQPPPDVIEQGRGALDDADELGMVGAQRGRIGESLDLQSVRRQQSELVLDQAELETLETRRGYEERTEVEEVERGHRLEHVDLHDEEAHDLLDAQQPREHRAQVALGDRGAAHDVEDGVELDENLLEPELARLVHADEEVLVVFERPGFRALGRLRLQQPVEVQVVPVVERVGRAVGRGVHRAAGGRRTRFGPFAGLARRPHGASFLPRRSWRAIVVPNRGCLHGRAPSARRLSM